MIITNDGFTAQGTPDEIVTTLRTNQRLQVAQDNTMYMAQVSQRVCLWQGRPLTYTTPAEFLEALRQAELLDILA